MTEARPSSIKEGMAVTKAVSLVRPLESGGMGAVWLADHAGLKTRVVVKFMLGELGASVGARARFSREAAAAALVKSPHVVQMLDHGVTDEGIAFIVMEHLEGHDLRAEIRARGALEPVTAVAIVVQVAKALTKVHAAGLLHRDIKPDNIFLCDGEEDVFAKLLDFGVVKVNGAPPDEASVTGDTQTGQIVGTPFYMSPEQVTAQRQLDSRSDLWALGVVAYEALTGKKPYDGPSFGALAVKIATGVPTKPTELNPALPPAFDAWFEKACALRPEERFATAREMSEALRSAFDGVVSLPAGALSGGDSGDCRPSESVPRPASSGSDDRDFGLATTAHDRAVSSGDRPADGLSSGRLLNRTTVLVAVAAFAIAGAAVLLVSRASHGTDEKMATNGTIPSAASALPSGVAQALPPAFESMPATPPKEVASPVHVEVDAGAASSGTVRTHGPIARPMLHEAAHDKPASSAAPKASSSKPTSDPDILY